MGSGTEDHPGGCAASSTRNWLCPVCDYGKVIREMAESCGIRWLRHIFDRSSVRREFIQASEDTLKALCERRFDDIELLIISQTRQSRKLP